MVVIDWEAGHGCADETGAGMFAWAPRETLTPTLSLGGRGGGKRLSRRGTAANGGRQTVVGPVVVKA